MTTSRYKNEQCEAVRKFLRDTPNAVELPTDIFFEIAELPDAERLNKLLNKAYTVVCADGEEIFGIASMDGEGNVGVFCVRSEKSVKPLLNALERRAEKRELYALFVKPTSDCSVEFGKFGYTPFDGDGEPNPYLLIKKIEKEIEFPPSAVKTFELDPSKPIKVEGKTSHIPWLAMGLTTFFAVLYTVILATRENCEQFHGTKSSAIAVGIVVGILFFFSLALFIAYLARGARLKREILSMRITNALVTGHVADEYGNEAVHTFSKKQWRNEKPERTIHHVYYEFYDEDMQLKKASFKRRYLGRGTFFFEGQELVIACSGEKSYILRKYTVKDAVGGETNEPEREKSDKNTLSVTGYVPLYCVKMYCVYALTFLLAFAFIVAAILAFAGIVASISSWTFENAILMLLPLIVFGTAATLLPSLGIFAIMLSNKIKFEKMTADPDTKVFEGKLVHGGGAYKSKNRLKFYCEYDDGTGIRRLRVFRKFTAVLVKRGKFSVRVAVNKSKAVVLVEEGKYPDVWSRFLSHY